MLLVKHKKDAVERLWCFDFRFLLTLVLGGLCSAKDPQTPKGGLRRGEKKEVVAALLLFPPP
jgi:hypothetical protein